MANSDERRPSHGAYATIFGALVTIGAVVLSNKQVRNKVLKMISTGIDKITAEGEGVKTTIQDTAERVEKGARKTMERVKDSVDELAAGDEGDKTKKGATR